MLKKTILALTLVCAATVAQGHEKHHNFTIQFNEADGGLTITNDRRSGLYIVEGTGVYQGCPGIAAVTPVKIKGFGMALAITFVVNTETTTATTMYLSYPIASGGKEIAYQHPEGGGMLKVGSGTYNVVNP